MADRDTPERMGGLALWAFGGMMLVQTPLQKRMKVKDLPEIALDDWLSFGELAPDNEWPLQWARYYVEHSRTEVYDWPADRPQPAAMLNGAHPHADGQMHHWVADNLGGQITHAEDVELRGRLWRRWCQRQTFAGRHLPARLHHDRQGSGAIHCGSLLTSINPDFR